MNISLEATVTSTLSSLGFLVAAMICVAALEAMAPHRPRDARHRAHLVPNLALTGITFATNAVLNVALIGALLFCEAHGYGVLNAAPVPSWVEIAVVVLALDLGWWTLHWSMHKVSAFWRVHRVHHSDLVLDVTSTIRQHPGEGLLRYAVLALVAIALGAGPSAFAVYRVWSALSGFFEHANLRLPRAIDTALTLVVSTPGSHRIHHSRDAALADTNYGNIFTLFDRLFGTWTPSARAVVECGVDGMDAPEMQTTLGLLRSPLEPEREPGTQLG